MEKQHGTVKTVPYKPTDSSQSFRLSAAWYCAQRLVCAAGTNSTLFIIFYLLSAKHRGGRGVALQLWLISTNTISVRPWVRNLYPHVPVPPLTMAVQLSVIRFLP